jgi:hypothetical protein
MSLHNKPARSCGHPSFPFCQYNWPLIHVALHSGHVLIIKSYARKNYPNFFSDFLGINPTFSDSVFLYCMCSLDPNSLGSPSPVHSSLVYEWSCRNEMLELHHVNVLDYHSIHRHVSCVVYLYHETALVCTPLTFAIFIHIIRTIEFLFVFSLI